MTSVRQSMIKEATIQADQCPPPSIETKYLLINRKLLTPELSSNTTSSFQPVAMQYKFPFTNPVSLGFICIVHHAFLFHSLSMLISHPRGSTAAVEPHAGREAEDHQGWPSSQGEWGFPPSSPNSHENEPKDALPCCHRCCTLTEYATS